jgi:hypothetical protein
MLPADACPFRRPFPPDFDACPAYQPRTFVALDLRYRPLHPVLTCQHLDVRAADATGHRYYGRCSIGDAAARGRWVEHVLARRVQTLRDLGAQIATITEPLLGQLWRAKGRQLDAQQSSRDDAQATHQLRATADRIRTQTAAFLRQHRTELEDAGLPYEVCLELVDAMLDRLVAHPSTDVPTTVPPELLARFPEAVQIFFDPRSSQRPRRESNSPGSMA